MTIRLGFMAGLICLAGCAATPPVLNLHLGGEQIDLKQYLKDRPIPKGQGSRVDRIASGPSTSVHLVQLRVSERPHLHARHDLRVVVVRGSGTMVIDGKTILAAVGSVFEIERGTPHFFLVGRGAAALVTFTPPYDGNDWVAVESK